MLKTQNRVLSRTWADRSRTLTWRLNFLAHLAHVRTKETLEMYEYIIWYASDETATCSNCGRVRPVVIPTEHCAALHCTALLGAMTKRFTLYKQGTLDTAIFNACNALLCLHH